MDSTEHKSAFDTCSQSLSKVRESVNDYLSSFSDAVPLPSRVKPTTESPVGQLSVFLESILKHPVDRQFLLSVEKSMTTLVTTDGGTMSKKLVYSSLNSYQRLIVYRCADYYGMGHMLKPRSLLLTVFCTSQSKVPEMQLKDAKVEALPSVLPAPQLNFQEPEIEDVGSVCAEMKKLAVDGSARHGGKQAYKSKRKSCHTAAVGSISGSLETVSRQYYSRSYGESPAVGQPMLYPSSSSSSSLNYLHDKNLHAHHAQQTVCEPWYPLQVHGVASQLPYVGYAAGYFGGYFVPAPVYCLPSELMFEKRHSAPTIFYAQNHGGNPEYETAATMRFGHGLSESLNSESTLHDKQQSLDQL